MLFTINIDHYRKPQLANYRGQWIMWSLSGDINKTNHAPKA